MKQKNNSPFLNEVRSLSYAGWTGCVDIAKFFVENKSDISDRDIDEALIEATDSGNHHLVKYLCLHQADVNFINEDGDTALHIAARSGNEKMVQCLVEMGAQTNIANSFGEKPLDVVRSQILSQISDVIEESKFERSKSDHSAPCLDTLNNIEVLLENPEKYRKSYKMNNTILSSADLDTVLNPDRKETSVEKKFREEGEKIADEFGKKRNRRVTFSEDTIFSDSEIRTGEETKEESIAGIDYMPPRLGSPSLPGQRVITSVIPPEGLDTATTAVSSLLTRNQTPSRRK